MAADWKLKLDGHAEPVDPKQVADVNRAHAKLGLPTVEQFRATQELK